MSELEIMYDDSEMTPQEREKAVRDRVTALKDELLKTAEHLSFLFQEYYYWQEVVAEIDFQGAEDYFYPRPAKHEYVSCSTGGNYVF